MSTSIPRSEIVAATEFSTVPSSRQKRALADKKVLSDVGNEFWILTMSVTKSNLGIVSRSARSSENDLADFEAILADLKKLLALNHLELMTDEDSPTKRLLDWKVRASKGFIDKMVEKMRTAVKPFSHIRVTVEKLEEEYDYQPFTSVI